VIPGALYHEKQTLPPLISRAGSSPVNDTTRSNTRADAEPTPRAGKPCQQHQALGARLVIVLALALAAGAASAQAQDPLQRFRIQVHQDGVYRIGYEQLETAGLDGPFNSSRLALANLGGSVKVRIEDGDDELFGPGDSLVFVGQRLRGDAHRYHEFSSFNVYVLDIGGNAEPQRMKTTGVNSLDENQKSPVALRRRDHMEHDLLRVPIAGPTGYYDNETLWYWKQLNHLASVPTSFPIDLSRMAREADGSFGLKLQFRGGSDSASAANLPVPDHVVEISLNGTLLDTGRWSGREPHLVEIPSIPVALVAPGRNEVGIRVRARQFGENPDPIIDVLYLDWLEAEFKRDLHPPLDQERVLVTAAENSGKLQLVTDRQSGVDPSHKKIELFTVDGFHGVARKATGRLDSAVSFDSIIPPGAQQIWLVPESRFLLPAAVELDHPSRLAASTEQRDYFIIAHSSLVEEAMPLAAFHERRGTRTELIDVQDIYDEFNYGIKHPQAIRDFLAHARRVRSGPPAGLVLLVGDASWNAGQADGQSAQSPGLNKRDLIPTWQLRSRDGPAASDNPFVALSGDDIHPDMAIGRMPAASPEELRFMVDKTVAYMANPVPGAWRSRVTLVSDSTRNLSARNALFARRASERGMIARELLAGPEEAGELHQERLRSALDEGMLVLHFFGHGGRFMWQTAPSRGDAGNLFDMQDLDLLEPNSRLPIVLSMSCATGPFDHPAADSLAEKFLRIQGRGAVAVVAASARNNPSVLFTDLLFNELLKGTALGEAFRVAKHARQHPDSAMFYNLFGDPALVAARPQGSVALEVVDSSPPLVKASLPIDDFSGIAELEWLNEDGEPTLEKLELKGAHVLLKPSVDLDGSVYRRLNIYVRDPATGRDASGTIALETEPGDSE